MFITFFCKRERHVDCPIKWPVNEVCESGEDCSFDNKIIECQCECHRVKRENIDK